MSVEGLSQYERFAADFAGILSLAYVNGFDVRSEFGVGIELLFAPVARKRSNLGVRPHVDLHGRGSRSTDWTHPGTLNVWFFYTFLS